MGRASSSCLVTGTLKVARTFGKVAQAAPSCRALRSGSDPQADVGSPWSVRRWQQQGLCIPDGVRAATSGAWFQCTSLCQPLR